MYTVKEAAAKLGATEETIRRWLRTKRIKGVMPGGQKLGYRIPEGEVERLLGGPSTPRSALSSHAERLGLDGIASGIRE
jgi:excisionase family DNA binding protein